MSRLILGVGNLYRRDDAVGVIVAQRLEKKVASNIAVLSLSGEGAALMDAWQKAKDVIVIDAVSSGAKPGTLFRFDAHAQSLPKQFFHYSTHAFSVVEAVELARALRQLPPCLILYGIEGKNFDSGVGLSPEVELAADELEKEILATGDWQPATRIRHHA